MTCANTLAWPWRRGSLWLSRRTPPRPRSSRSASCPGSSIRSTRSCSSALRRRRKTSASTSSRKFRRPGASRRRRRSSTRWSRAATSTTSSPPRSIRIRWSARFRPQSTIGIKVITVDTFLGDGDYVNGPVKFPISYIGSDNVEGGRIAARGLAKAIGGKGNRLHQLDQPERQLGRRARQRLQGGDGQGLPRHQGGGSGLQPGRRQQGDAADRGGAGARTQPRRASSAPTCSARRARAPRSSTRASAATSRLSPMTRPSRQSSSWTRASSALVLAQKPFDMGYLAVMFAQADAAGVTSLPRRVETGFAIIDKSNVKDPAIARFIYQVPGK